MRYLIVGLLVVTGTVVRCLADDMPQQSVRISPAKNISLELPLGWIACNEMLGEKTSNSVDALDVDRLNCKADPANNHFILKSTDPKNPALMFLLLGQDSSITKDMINSLTPSSLSGPRVKLCEKAAQMLLFAAENCDIEVGKIPAGPAILGQAVGRMNKSQANIAVRIALVAFDGGTMLLLAGTSADKPPNDDIEAIINSITLK